VRRPQIWRRYKCNLKWVTDDDVKSNYLNCQEIEYGILSNRFKLLFMTSCLPNSHNNLYQTMPLRKNENEVSTMKFKGR
jgi:hypothetical protein